jgi:hypothetical protein
MNAVSGQSAISVNSILAKDNHTVSEVGTVQGGSVSPLLANIYLLYVFDLWVQREPLARCSKTARHLVATKATDRSTGRQPGAVRSCAAGLRSALAPDVVSSASLSSGGVSAHT